MSVQIILTPSFQNKIKDKRFRPHISLIERLIKKVEKIGKNALKILDVEDNYLLGELKVKKPPYRLYVIVDERSNKFYIVDWDHKKKQEKIINELKTKLTLAIQSGLEKIFT